MLFWQYNTTHAITTAPLHETGSHQFDQLSIGKYESENTTIEQLMQKMCALVWT